MTISYYFYDGIAVRVTESDHSLLAEGYFAGRGFVPVSSTPVLWNGELMTEREFKNYITNLRRTAVAA